MDRNSAQDEILRIANAGEVGGGHDEKGGIFRRHWAIMRMFELESGGADDFFVLFEAIQDVAELDSRIEPKTIRIYQAKKREGKYWSWNELTGFTDVIDPSKATGFLRQNVEKMRNSIVGKLYADVLAFSEIHSEGFFVSNSGCDLRLPDGGNATKLETCCLSALAEPHLGLLKAGLAVLHGNGKPLPDASRITIQRVDLPPNDPGPYLRGIVGDFLTERSPNHASQARALVDALLAKISSLCVKTDRYPNFEQMCNARGFGRDDLAKALSCLESMPDEEALLEDYLRQLSSEKADMRLITSIRKSAARLRCSKLGNSFSEEEKELINDCDKWLERNRIMPPLAPILNDAWNELTPKHSSFRRHEMLAFLLQRAIQICEDLTYED